MNLNNQNNQKSLQLLAAQAQLYSKSKWWVYLIFLVTLAPLLAFFLKKHLPDIEHLFLTLGAGGLFLVYVLNRYVSKKIKTAALIQEELDTDIYEWEWNTQLGENKVIKDIRNRAAGNYAMPDNRLPWYTQAIETLADPGLQILLCQRENVIWDWQLKKKIWSKFTSDFLANNCRTWYLGVDDSNNFSRLAVHQFFIASRFSL